MNRLRTIVIILTAATLLFASCHPKQKLFDPVAVDFKADYNPVFDGLLYPSMILALSGTSASTTAQNLFTVEVTSPRDNAVLRVVIDSSNLNYVTIFQEVMPRRGERYTFSPAVKWKYDNLYRMRQQGVADLTFTCFINDEEVDVKNLRLNYRSVNECPLTLVSRGETYDFRWLFSAYVNEEHPYIDQILTEILDQGTISRFVGYQSGEKAVCDQVFAIWHYALSRGITYSSISCTPNPSRKANVQHIRFFDEVYNTKQANCVDACVFFASIMRKIGLKPVIFVEPCHAYLGYYTDKNRKHVELLETTITSWVNYPDMERNLDADGRLPQNQLDKISKYLTDKQLQQYEAGKMTFDELKLALSHQLFDRASTYNAETYTANLSLFADSTQAQYQQLDLELLRKQVQPISSPR
ncbi:MAG: hypothetical protein IJ789_05315 [Bacteroidales bacterium]|nr:hypothetical protein [Bacteroidales bacterium]